jgi:MraZ protein
MGAACYFSGSSLADVDVRGRVALPAFIVGTLRRRSDSATLFVRAHETDPCLTGYNLAYSRMVARDFDRRRLLAEPAGLPSPEHHALARRLFGFGEEVNGDDNGLIELPAMMRQRGGIGSRALFIGAGGTFEIWSPERALAAADQTLRELAASHFTARGLLFPDHQIAMEGA